MESWKVNLISVWFGCFFTGLAISQILPFLPLYVFQLGVTSHEALSMWSGLTFSVTFRVSAIVSPMWGSLADRKGRKLMLLRASLGMAIAILRHELPLLSDRWPSHVAELHLHASYRIRHASDNVPV